MQQLPPFPDRYWLKFSNEPVEIAPFNPRSEKVAEEYIYRLQTILVKFPVNDIYHRGSTALKIAGKGDIEIGVIPDENYWFEVIVDLSQHFHGLGNLDEEYARFNDRVDDFDIEVILMRGHTAKLDKKLHTFLLANTSLLNEYKQIKQDYCNSQREYNRQKDQFFRRVIERIPG